MKTAISQQGEQIVAKRDAPATAHCPHCGGEVTLRGRRTMNGTVTFFWRHQHSRALRCPKRGANQ